MSDDEVEIKSGFTLKTIAIALVLLVLTTFLAVTSDLFSSVTSVINQPFRGPWDFYYRAPAYTAFGFILVIVFVIALINRSKPIFSRQEVAVLCAVPHLGILLAFADGANVFSTPSLVPAGLAIVKSDLLAKYVSPVLGPTDMSVWNSFLPVSTLAIPWGAFALPITWSFLYILSFTCCILCSAMLYNVLMIDVEDMQFPLAEIKVSLVDSTQPKSEGVQRILHNKMFWATFLVYFVFIFATHGRAVLAPIIEGLNTVPTRGSYVGMIWGTGVYAWTQADVTEALAPILPGVGMMINVGPHFIGWQYILPIEVLTGIIVGWMFVWIGNVGIVWNLTGRTPSAMLTAKHWMQTQYNFQTGGIITGGLGHYFVNGVLIGLFVYTLVRHRRLFIREIRAAFGSEEKLPPQPLSYRNMLLGLIGSFVMWCVLVVIAGVDWSVALAWNFVSLLSTMGSIRLIGKTGGPFGLVESSDSAWYFPGYPTGSSIVWDYLRTKGLNNETLATYAYVSCGWSVESSSQQAALHFVGANISDNFKIGNLTKTTRKSLFSATVISLIIAIFVGVISMILWLGIAPISPKVPMLYNVLGTRGMEWNSMATGLKTGNPTANITRSYYVNIDYSRETGFIYGIATIAAIFILREKIAWFRIAPEGFAYGTLFVQGTWMLWPSIIALIAKYLTVKTGGSRLYEEKGKPMALGFVFAYSFWILIAAVINGSNTWNYIMMQYSTSI